MKWGRNIALTLVCIMLGVMLSWQLKSIDYNKVQTSMQNRRVEDIMKDLIAEQKKVEDLQARLEELKRINQELEDAKAGGNELVNTIRDQLKVARIFGGFVPVKGKGVIVKLEDSASFSVSESDVLSVVNELRAAGAQAISVNEERIVAMSEIREAGGYIVVNGVQLKSPYIIKAIASPDKLERSLMMIGGIKEELEKWIRITITKADEVVIPAVRDDGSVIKIDQLTPVE